MRIFAMAAAALLALGACAVPPGHVAPHDRNLITADEIAKSSASNAYEAVERLRPAFLRTRGVESIRNSEPPTPMIYLDGVRYGPLQSLTTVPAAGILSIQYLSAVDATQRFGMGHSGGAILITTKH